MLTQGHRDRHRDAHKHTDTHLDTDINMLMEMDTPIWMDTQRQTHTHNWIQTHRNTDAHPWSQTQMDRDIDLDTRAPAIQTNGHRETGT